MRRIGYVGVHPFFAFRRPHWPVPLQIQHSQTLVQPVTAGIRMTSYCCCTSTTRATVYTSHCKYLRFGDPPGATCFTGLHFSFPNRPMQCIHHHSFVRSWRKRFLRNSVKHPLFPLSLLHYLTPCFRLELRGFSSTQKLGETFGGKLWR